MPQGFLALVGGRVKQILGIATSAGAADAGKIGALGPDGRWDMSMMPAGIGANTQQLPVTEGLTAGAFVNFWGNAGVLSVRLADAASGREANGYVLAAFANAATATVYPLDGVNSALTGLTPGVQYWLGNAGAVTVTPLDATLAANVNKVNQLLGYTKSATELVTDDYGFQIL